MKAVFLPNCQSTVKPQSTIQSPARSFLSPPNRYPLERPRWVSVVNTPGRAFPRDASSDRASEPLTAVERVRDDATAASAGGGVKRKKLAAFVSGNGSNFRAIQEACLVGSVHGDVAVLVTNKGGCVGAAYARENGIPVVIFPRTKDEPDGLFASDLVATLR